MAYPASAWYAEHQRQDSSRSEARSSLAADCRKGCPHGTRLQGEPGPRRGSRNARKQRQIADRQRLRQISNNFQIL
jgi:hypothetical protein